MSRSTGSMRRWSMAVVAAGALSQASSARAQATAQKMDADYTAQIKEYLPIRASRPSSSTICRRPRTVPTPLKFLGHIVGTPGELDHAADIHRYLEAVAEGRADAREVLDDRQDRRRPRHGRSSRSPTRRRSRTSTSTRATSTQLTDPRKTTEAQAQQLIKTAKPIYYITSGMHSPESGGPEMLMELAYRLIVEETPFIQNIRNNVITLITPVVEVDGREKYVDTYYFNKKWQGSRRRPAAVDVAAVRCR